MKAIKNINLLEFLIFVLFTSFSIFMGSGNRNLLLIAVMGIFSIFSVRVIFSQKSPIQYSLIVFIILSIWFACINHYTRWSTILYTCMYTLFFLYLINLINKTHLNVNLYLKFIEFLLSLYAIVLLLQQICVLFGLPIFNGINCGTVHSLFRLNSLSPEPSHTVRYVGVLMVSHVIISREYLENGNRSLLKDIKLNYKAWIPFIYIIISSGSGTGVLIFVLITFLFLSFKNIILLSTITIGAILILTTLDYNPIDRTTRFIVAVVSGNPKAMMAADHSASVRIVPVMIALDEFHPFSFDGLFGRGVDYMASILSSRMTGLGSGSTAGGAATFLLERGLILGLIYLITSFKVSYMRRYRVLSIGLWILCVVLTPINTPLPWAFMTLFYLTKKIISHNETTSI